MSASSTTEADFFCFLVARGDAADFVGAAALRLAFSSAASWDEMLGELRGRVPVLGEVAVGAGAELPMSSDSGTIRSPIGSDLDTAVRPCV